MMENQEHDFGSELGRWRVELIHETRLRPPEVYLADILSAFCIPMGCEGTLIDLPFI